MNPFRSRLLRRLLLVALIAATPAIAAILVIQSVARQRGRERTIADNQRLVRLAANQQASVVNGAQLLLQTIAELSEVRAADPEACLDLLPRILASHPGYLALTVVNADGTLFCSTVPPDRLVHANARGRAWFDRVMETRTRLIGDYQFSAVNGTPSIVIAQPLLDREGDVSRIVVAVIGVAHLQTVMSSTALPAGATLTLIDRRGTILARSRDAGAWIGHRVPDPEPLERLATGATDVVTDGVGVDGIRRLYVTVPVRTTDGTAFYMGLGIEHDAAFRESDRIYRAYIWLLAIVSLAGLGAAAIGAQLSVLRPLKTLKAVADRIAAGDLGARAQLASRVGGVSELGEAVNAMAGALKAREDDRELVERELRASEDRYRLLFAQNPHPMWVYDAATLEFLEVNDAAVQRYGYTRSEFVAMRITDIRPTDEVGTLLDTLAAGRHDSMRSAGWHHRLKSGETIAVEITSHTLTFAGRAAVVVTAQDITLRARAEAALAERAALTALTAGVGAALNRLADLRAALPSCAETIGAYPGIARVEISLIEPETGALDTVAACGAIEEGAAEVLTTAGWPLAVGDRVIGQLTLFSRAPLSDTAADGLSSLAAMIALGVTRRQTERALHEAEERMRFALETSHVGVWEANLRTGEGYLSTTCEAMHGLAPGSFGRTYEDFVARVHPDDRTDVRHQVARALERRTPSEMEYRTVWPDGTIRRINLIAHFSSDAANVPVRAAGVAIDVTERRSLEEQLRQSQKMDAVGQLAGGIAHDFNNLLTVIQGCSEFLSDALPAPDARRADVDHIHGAAQRAAALTRQLLAFSRKQILSVRIVHVGDIVGDVAPMLRRLLGETIDLRTAVGNRGLVKTDPGQLEQVIVNLAVNARDAMPDGGTLTLETSDVVLDEAFVRRHPSVSRGPHVMLTVTDTGHGMDAATQKRVFEPFFTTKPLGQGTGLGLATVYGIVKQSGGSIWVDSRPGRGTTFKVYFPRTDGVEESAPAPTATAVPPGAESVLLIEDEDAVRELVKRVLTRQGYTVHAVGDPIAALDYAQAHDGPIDLIVSDVILPTMNGRILATRIRETHPESRVLLMSGYTGEVIALDGALSPGTGFLPKPFTVDALTRTVREVLDAPVPPETSVSLSAV